LKNYPHLILDSSQSISLQDEDFLLQTFSQLLIAPEMEVFPNHFLCRPIPQLLQSFVVLHKCFSIAAEFFNQLESRNRGLLSWVGMISRLKSNRGLCPESTQPFLPIPNLSDPFERGRQILYSSTRAKLLDKKTVQN